MESSSSSSEDCMRSIFWSDDDDDDDGNAQQRVSELVEASATAVAEEEQQQPDAVEKKRREMPAVQRGVAGEEEVFAVGSAAKRARLGNGAALPRVSLNTRDKAGLEGVDEEAANKIIFEASKDSKYFANEKLKQTKVKKRVGKLKRAMAEVEKEDARLPHDAFLRAKIRAIRKEVDAHVRELDAGRELDCHWLHVDMDAFYAMVEIRDDPSLRGKPVGVGGMGMLSTSNYVARKFGVRSAMPGFIAKELCPQLIFVKPNYKKYKAAAALTRAVFAQYDPDFRAASLDEAALHITDYCRRHAVSRAEVAKKIQEQVYEATSLTCSVGAAANRRLAKIASNVKKPNGFFDIPNDRERIVQFMRTLPLRKVAGVGPVTESILTSVGFSVCGDLWDERYVLARVFSERSWRWYLDVALGFASFRSNKMDEDTLRSERKSISCERTFGAGVKPEDHVELEARLQGICQRLAEHMTSKGLRGKTVTLKLKSVDFGVKQRGKTLSRPIGSQEELLSAVRPLLREEIRKVGPIRLLGVKVHNFPHQRDDALDEGQRTIKDIFGGQGAEKNNGSASMEK